MAIESVTVYGQGDDHVLKAVWYYEVSSGTTGQVETPSGGAILLDEFASGVDALCVGMSGAGGFVNWEEVEEADTTTVAVSSFDTDGNFVLTGVSSGYPVAIVFVYVVAGVYYDYTKDFLEHEIPGVGGSFTFIDLTDTPAAYTGQGGKIPQVNIGETALEFVTPTADHGDLTGLNDNDHNQYALLDGSNQPFTGTIDMNDNPIVDIGYIDLNLVNGIASAEGRLVWNDDDGTINIGMKGGVVNLQVGQEMLVRGKNTSGATINNGEAIRITGGTGNFATFGLSDADDPATAGSIGLATEEIPDNQFGYATTSGLVRDLNTSDYDVGDRLYLSNVPGILTTTAPTSTERVIFIGVVIRDHVNEGIVWVNPINVSYLSELSGNNITSPTDNEILAYDSGSGLWINQTPTEAGLDSIYLKLDTSNDPLTGDLEISKADPEIKLTDTGDSNNTRIVRSDSFATAQRFNTAGRLGAIGNALDFEGNDDALSIAAPISLGGGDFTIATWYNADAFGNFDMLLAQYEIALGGHPEFELSFRTGNLIIGRVVNTAAANFQVSTSIGGGWELIILRKSGTDLRLFQNNVDKSNTTISGTIVTGAFPLHIGCRDFGSGDADFYNGRVDETAIWSRALSINDMSDIWNGGDGLPVNKDSTFPTDGGSQGTDLELLFHYNESVMNSAPGGTDVADFSGNGRHGTTAGSMTDGDFVEGKVLQATDDVEISIWKSEDGEEDGISGKTTFGDSSGKTILGGDTLRFNIANNEKAKIDENGTLIINNGVTTAQAQIVKEAAAQSEVILEHQLSDGTKVNSFNAGGGALLGGNVIIGRGAAGVDYTQTWNGETNDGVVTWMEDEDYFTFGDDILMSAAEKVQLRDTAIGIYSQANTFGDMFADGGWRIGDSSAGAPTNYSQFGPDGSITQVGTARIDWTKIAANGANVTGCTTSSSVSDLQTDNDGNTYVCAEVAATPNYLIVDFSGVTAFNWLRILASYQGNALHNLLVQLEITPFDGSVWYTLNSIAHQAAATITMVDYSFFIPNDVAYINSGVVKVRFLHSATEANGHPWTFDEVSLYQ